MTLSLLTKIQVGSVFWLALYGRTAMLSVSKLVWLTIYRIDIRIFCEYRDVDIVSSLKIWHSPSTKMNRYAEEEIQKHRIYPNAQHCTIKLMPGQMFKYRKPLDNTTGILNCFMRLLFANMHAENKTSCTELYVTWNIDKFLHDA